MHAMPTNAAYGDPILLDGNTTIAIPFACAPRIVRKRVRPSPTYLDPNELRGQPNVDQSFSPAEADLVSTHSEEPGSCAAAASASSQGDDEFVLIQL